MSFALGEIARLGRLLRSVMHHNGAQCRRRTRIAGSPWHRLPRPMARRPTCSPQSDSSEVQSKTEPTARIRSPGKPSLMAGLAGRQYSWMPNRQAAPTPFRGPRERTLARELIYRKKAVVPVTRGSHPGRRRVGIALPESSPRPAAAPRNQAIRERGADEVQSLPSSHCTGNPPWRMSHSTDVGPSHSCPAAARGYPRPRRRWYAYDLRAIGGVHNGQQQGYGGLRQAAVLGRVRRAGYRHLPCSGIQR